MYESKQSYIQLKEDANVTLKRLLANLKTPMWNVDREEIDSLISLEMENNNIYAIKLYDELERLNVGKIRYYNGDVGNMIIDQDIKSLFYIQKTIEREHTIIGNITVYFTDAHLKKSLRFTIFKIVIQIIILTIMIIVVISMSVNRVIISPIIQLTKTVNNFSEKNFNVRSDLDLENEIGILGDTFNSMAQIIEDYSEHLEDIVEKRTNQLNKLNKELFIAYDQMKKELKIAQKIQESIIPKNLDDFKNIGIGGYYMPMALLGGDYYDVYKIGENKLGIVIADVCGHGVPASLITIMAKVLFNNYSNKDKTTGEIITMINDELLNIMGEIEFLTAFFGIIDFDSGMLHYSNAGHPEILILKPNNNFINLTANSPIIGFCKNVDFLTESIKIGNGDKLILYTDGVIEARNKKNDWFGIERLKECVYKNKHLPAKELVTKISKEIYDHKGNNILEDDIAMLIIDINFDFEEIDNNWG